MTQPNERPPHAEGPVVAVSRRALVAIVAAAMAVVLALAGVVVAVLRAPSAAATETSLEPVNTSQENPFMPEPAGSDAQVGGPPAGASGPVSGSTAGLFGGSGSNSCDRDQIASFLTANPDRGAAWAEATGVRQDQISDFVHELSPLLLRADTAVTNHRYEDGDVVAYPSILQAGTAVLVDGYGTPRVKCYCGNPLSAPPRDVPARYEGRAWPRFDTVRVIVIRPAPVIVNNFTIINIRNNVVVNVYPPPWSYGPPDLNSPLDPPVDDDEDLDPGQGNDLGAGAPGSGSGNGTGDLTTTTTTTTTTTSPTTSPTTTSPTTTTTTSPTTTTTTTSPTTSPTTTTTTAMEPPA